MNIVVSDLVKTLIVSTRDYNCKKIHSTKDKSSYAKSMNRCVAICEQYGENMTYATSELVAIINSDALNSIKNSLLGHEKKYYIEGLNHCLDVLNCVNKRFVTGGSGSDRPFIESILERSGYES